MKFNISGDEYEWDNNWLINTILKIISKERKKVISRI